MYRLSGVHSGRAVFKHLIPLLLLSLFIASGHADTWFVATDGDDGNTGTIDEPLATLQKAHDECSAGDTIYLRGGTYEIETSADRNTGISFTKSGRSDDERIYIWAYGDEIPVLDFNKLNLANIGAGIRVQGEWLHFKGIEICNVKAQVGGNNGIWCNPCTHNIFEELDLHHNEGPGLSIANGEGDLLILNCDSHDNYDKNNRGEDADGFGVHYQTRGDTIRFKGCRGWWNSDDGYDLFKQQFPVVIENCWAYGNGYINQGTGNGANGSGFKMGNSQKPEVRHTISGCVSWGNKNQGFYANHSPGGSNWYNNTSYKNGSQFDMFSDAVLSGGIVHVLKNNIAFPKVLRNTETSDMAFNTWDLDITPSENDFESIDDDGWMGPRKADGSLPDIPFLKLKEESGLVDKGTDIGLPFAGEAPDLGAYETGMTTATVLPRKKDNTSFLPSVSTKGLNCNSHIYDIKGRALSYGNKVAGTGLIIEKNANGRTRLYVSASSGKSIKRSK